MTTSIYRKPGVIEIAKGWDFNYKVSQYHENMTLIFTVPYFTFYVSLPDIECEYGNIEDQTWDRQWGVNYHDSHFWFQWGKKSFNIEMPWSWTHVRHEIMFPDMTLRKPLAEPWDTSDGRLVRQYDYRYTLKSGEVQERKATVYIGEREWRWTWFQWLKFPRMINRSIDVEFNDEVGERTGSWKGGCTGCGYDMLPGETMEETLRRMEKERKF